MNTTMPFEVGYTYCNTNSTTPPWITTFREQIHCFYQEKSSKRLMCVHSSNGIYWDSAHALNIGGVKTSAGPCCVIFRDQFHVFFRDGSGRAIFHMVSPDGRQWSKPYNIGQDCESHISAAVHNDELVLAYRDAGGKGIMRSIYKGGAWDHGYTGFNMSGNFPGIVVFNNAYHIFFRDGSGNGVLNVVSSNAKEWRAANPFHVYETKTSASPTAVVYKDQLHVFYRDYGGNAIFHAVSNDGSTFVRADPFNTTLNLDEGPAAAVLGDMLCLAGVDAGGFGVMRALYRPPITSSLKGWDYILALRLGIVKALPTLGAESDIELTDPSLNGTVHVRFASAAISPPRESDASGPDVSFPVRFQLKPQQPHADSLNIANAHFVVMPSIYAKPSSDKAGRWNIMLDFDKLLAPPRLEGGSVDPAVANRLTEALASKTKGLPAMSLGSFEAPFGSSEPFFNYSEFIFVKDRERQDGVLLALLSTRGYAPDVPDCRLFTPSVLPPDSDVGLYASNERVIRFLGGMVQEMLREKMGEQGKDGTRPLEYSYAPVPGAPLRLRAYTRGNYCRFWEEKYQPSVDESWVDTAYSRLTVFLRLRATPSEAPDTAVYPEVTPSLMLQIASNPSQICIVAEEPIPVAADAKGRFAVCARPKAEDAAAEVAQKLKDAFSKIQPIDIGTVAMFTALSINQLGELFLAVKQK